MLFPMLSGLRVLRSEENDMNVKTKVTGSLLLAIFVVGGALADSRYDDTGAFFTYAKVIDVQPIVRVVQVTTPRQACWEEPVTRAHYPRHGRSATPVLLGGILGGVVGNQFGGGSGKDIMTVAGALLGASIGRDAAYRNSASQPHTTYTTTERRCQTETTVHEEERIDGYNVSYRYQGKTFVTRMPDDPGDRVRIRVRVASAGY